MLAGGFGLAHGIKESGLSDLLSTHLSFVSGMPLYFLLVTICLVTVFMTVFTSNVATISVFVPILSGLSVSIGQNPLLLLIPATLSSSYAFMLPIATPPNAIVFSSGRMKVVDMVTTGGLLNFLGLLLVPAFMLLFSGIFDIVPNTLPPWANLTKSIL
uniref:Citrate transporter-like domain-containing protein n=1 Tax=Arcella intermedia TaxID=1963864 RepID=A0A6B2LMU9_9EUKA